MVIIADGKKIADGILENLALKVKTLKSRNKQVYLGVILVGSDKASQSYVGKKEEAAKQIGVNFFLQRLPESLSQPELIAELHKIQKEKKLSGLIVQLPLPEKLKEGKQAVLNQIEFEVDVDCLSAKSSELLAQGGLDLIPPTPAAILEILNYYGFSLESKKIVIIGKGQLIGRPLAAVLSNRGLKYEILGKDCDDLSLYTKTADIIICGVGKKNLIGPEMVKEGVAIIDAGVSFENGKMFGDVDYDAVKQKAALITPVPGGVGPVTVAKLLENTIVRAEKNFE